MDLQTMRQQILDSQFSEARYSTYADAMLNEAYLKIARRANIRALFDSQDISTVAGVESVVFDENFARLYSLEDSENDTHLTWLDTKDFDVLASDTRGRPSWYTIPFETLDVAQALLWPIPDAVYTLRLRYYKTPTTMVDDTDEPDLPDSWQQLLVTYALSRCYRREHDLEQAQAHMAEFEKELAEMKADLQDDTQDATQAAQVGGMWGPSSGAIRAVRP